MDFLQNFFFEKIIVYATKVSTRVLVLAMSVITGFYQWFNPLWQKLATLLDTKKFTVKRSIFLKYENKNFINI